MNGLAAFRARFSSILKTFFENKLSQHALLLPDVFLQQIEAYSQELAQGGKQIRPYLVYLGASWREDEPNAGVLSLCLALELFHLFALVHDDVMDQGLMRHGHPTAHRFIQKKLEEAERIGDLSRTSESQAILLGDLLLNWAWESLHQGVRHFEDDQAERIRALFTKMIDEVILGQMLDIDLTTRANATVDLIEQKMFLKTTTYTFLYPLQMGAAAVGVEKEELDKIAVFSRALGFAFQLQDDLLDLTSATVEVGKSIFSDLKERQQTLFTQFIQDRGTSLQKTELTQLLGRSLTEDDRTLIQRLFTDSGAFSDGQQKIADAFARAKEVLEQMNVSPATKSELAQLSLFLEKRVS